MSRAPFIGLVAVGLLCLAPASAAAAPRVWVESAGFEKRAEALALEDRLEHAGVMDGGSVHARVVRRFVAGQGWRHVVQLDGVSDQEAALALAARIAAAGEIAQVLADDGGEVRVIARPKPVAPAVTGSGAPVDVAANDAGQGLIRAAVKAHGGARSGLAALQGADSVQFTFERRITTDAGSLLASNRYARQGDALRLEVDVVEGQGVDSVTVLSPGNRATLRQGDSDELLERDPSRTREVLARFSPEQVLAVALSFPVEAGASPTWQELVPTGQAACGKDRCDRLARPGPTGEPGLLEALFDRGTHQLRDVTWATEGGRLRFSMDGYRTTESGLVAPGTVTVTRDGTTVEEIRVLELQLDLPLEGALFDAP
ncbi:MAG: hypothetical protein H6742_02000 [Alphaproteobacteria bacterium]|nr:hypothetical protein [Alphaproteobacteria bacterium]